MDRAQKREFVASMHEVFKTSEVVVVCLNKGLSVAEVTALRTDVRAVGAGIRVVKNRLAKRALEGVDNMANIDDLLTGPTMIAYAEDPVSAAKAVHTFAEKNAKLEIVGGAMGEVKLDVNSIKALASLPSLDEIRGKIIGILTTPATKIAQILQAPGGQVARVIKAHADKNAA